jgi:hypothetical protein
VVALAVIRLALSSVQTAVRNAKQDNHGKSTGSPFPRRGKQAVNQAYQIAAFRSVPLDKVRHFPGVD